MRYKVPSCGSLYTESVQLVARLIYQQQWGFVTGQLWQHVSWLNAKRKHWPCVVIYYILYDDKYMYTYICGKRVAYTACCVSRELALWHFSACCLIIPDAGKCVGNSHISRVNLGILAQARAVILDPGVLSTGLCTCPVICLLSDWQARCYSV